MLREEVFMALATFGHKETHEELKKRFQIYISDKSTSVFPVDIRKVNHAMKVLIIMSTSCKYLVVFLNFSSGCLYFYHENFKWC